MGPTPGSWSQHLLGWGLGTCLLNRYCKHRNCSWRTTAQSPVDPDSLVLSSPHPSCLLSRHEHGPFRGPRCPTSPGTSMSICDSYLVSQLQEEQKIKPHMTAPPSRSMFRGVPVICRKHLQFWDCLPPAPLPCRPSPGALAPSFWNSVSLSSLLGFARALAVTRGAPPFTLLLRFLPSESSSAVLGFLHAL